MTTPPYVKDIKYVEPKTEMTNIETVKQYRSREMSALGIGFMNSDGQQTVSTAKVSFDQLIRTVNQIGEQIEDILKRWYRIRLEDAGIDAMFSPEVKITSSEMMSIDTKMSYAQKLYTIFNASADTAFDAIGLSAAEEVQKRLQEREDGYEDALAPRQTSYTASGGSGSSGDSDKKTGRPKGEETEKQIYDQQRNEDSK